MICQAQFDGCYPVIELLTSSFKGNYFLGEVRDTKIFRQNDSQVQRDLQTYSFVHIMIAKQ